MALGRPQRSASDDLKWPQMTSILLGARDEKFGRNSLYGLWGRYMALEVITWPWNDLRGLKRPQMTSIVLKWPQLSSNDLNIARCPWRKVWTKSVIWHLRLLYGLWGRYMALEVVIWPWRSIYGLGMALGWPWRSASDDLNIGKCPWRKVWMKFIIWPLRSLYDLGGHYMALEVIIWPWRSLYGLGGRPQMTSEVSRYKTVYYH